MLYYIANNPDLQKSHNICVYLFGSLWHCIKSLQTRACWISNSAQVCGDPPSRLASPSLRVGVSSSKIWMKCHTQEHIMELWEASLARNAEKLAFCQGKFDWWKQITEGSWANVPLSSIPHLDGSETWSLHWTHLDGYHLAVYHICHWFAVLFESSLRSPCNASHPPLLH